MSEQFFKDIFDHNFEGILILDSNLKITRLNRAAEEITGFSALEAVGRYCYEILRARRCKNACPLKTMKKDDRPGEFIVDILTRDNKKKYIKTRVIHSHNHWVEIFFDITREVELEKKMTEKYHYEDIITRTKSLQDILSQFPKIAAGNVPVLLQGESGAGKEVFATAIQSLSKRKDKPFIKMNCAALPETLLESELFGYKKGAFTDARTNKPGIFLSAHQGTLFLDEIGEMSLALQAKLLRAVETGEIIPLGSRGPENVDVRILAATNKDLNREVKEGRFREDLFYRLNVVPIRIPPLRERKNDIPLFIDYFIDHLNIIQQKNITRVQVAALDILMNFSYPGNIRELKNIIEYAFIFCDSGEIQVNHLPQYLRFPSQSQDTQGGYSAMLDLPRQYGEREWLLGALEQAGWKRSKAAEILQIDRTTLWRKMKKYNLTS